MNMKNKIKPGKLMNQKYSSLLLIIFILVPLSVFTFGSISKVWNSVTHDKTNFPLTGKHRTVSCSECHKKSGKDNLVSLSNAFHRQCKGCHEIVREKEKITPPVMCGQCHKNN